MKYTAIIVALAATTIPMLADDLRFLNDLERLQKQRDKDVATALDPINRRYQTALEQLRRKAAQANDLDAANKIQKAAEAVPKPLPQAAAAEFSGVWTLKQGDWTTTLELKPDGSIHFFSPGLSGTWEKTEKELRINYTHAKQTDMYKLPLKNDKISGIDTNGNSKSLTRKSQ